MLRIFFVVSVVGLIPAIASAEHKSSTDNDFTVTLKTHVNVSPKVAYAKFLNIKNWWHSSHTFSSNAKNLYIDAKPKGWWGEKLPDGGFVRHMEVIYAAPGKVIRFQGGLGPLQAMPLYGVMTVVFKPQDKGTDIHLVYAVGGFVQGGVKRMAAPVDGVLQLQLKRLKTFADKGEAGKDAPAK